MPGIADKVEISVCEANGSVIIESKEVMAFDMFNAMDQAKAYWPDGPVWKVALYAPGGGSVTYTSRRDRESYLNIKVDEKDSKNSQEVRTSSFR